MRTEEHAGFWPCMVFSSSLDVFLQIFCQHSLFLHLLNWRIVSVTFVPKSRLSSPILTVHCSLSFCMVSGAYAEVSLEKGFSMYLCIMVKMSGVAFNIKCFYSVQAIPIKALKKEATTCPAQFFVFLPLSGRGQRVYWGWTDHRDSVPCVLV